MRFEIRQASHREEVSTESDFVVFGRDRSSDIVIRDPRVSRRHLSLRVVPEGFRLLDLGSSNGVFVLGQRVEDAIIREGDVFALGDVFVRVLPEDLPPTLAMPRSEATMVQTEFAAEPPRRLPPEPREPREPPPLPPSPPRPWAAASSSVSPKAPRPAVAGPALGASSILVGLGVMGTALFNRSQLGALVFLVAPLGALSIAAGLGSLGKAGWARGLHYVLFTAWILSCVLAPFGGVGITYQIKGKDHPENDGFFAVVIGIALALAMTALIGASLLLRLYVPAPVPL